MIHLYRSNRLEERFSVLSEKIQEPPANGSPFDPETIVIQSRSMQDWLSMELSRRQGICANVDFPFPHALVKRVYNAIEGREEEDNWLEQGQLLPHYFLEEFYLQVLQIQQKNLHLKQQQLI